MRVKILSAVALVIVVAVSYGIKKAASPRTADAYEIRQHDTPSTAEKSVSPSLSIEPSDQQDYRIVTMDGWDNVSKTTINPINLWSNYQRRTFAGKAQHGDKVNDQTRRRRSPHRNE